MRSHDSHVTSRNACFFIEMRSHDSHVNMPTRCSISFLTCPLLPVVLNGRSFCESADPSNPPLRSDYWRVVGRFSFVPLIVWVAVCVRVSRVSLTGWRSAVGATWWTSAWGKWTSADVWVPNRRRRRSYWWALINARPPGGFHWLVRLRSFAGKWRLEAVLLPLLAPPITF